MICDPCGEMAEAFITQGHGELCEAFQRIVQEENGSNLGEAGPKA